MRTAVLLLAGALLTGPVAIVAANAGATELLPASGSVEVVFSDEEIRIIRAHYESQSGNKHKGHGRHKQHQLPPGISKNLARGKALPPGIAKQFLPDDLQRALPPVRDGHERVIVAGKVLLVEIATQVVRDVLIDVLMD